MKNIDKYICLMVIIVIQAYQIEQYKASEEKRQNEKLDTTYVDSNVCMYEQPIDFKYIPLK